MPSFYSSILSKNRNIFSINACIAAEKPFIAKFRIFNALSGSLTEMNKLHMQRIDYESKSNQMKLLYIPCFSLNTILSAINVTKVDYFSLDVEGGELSVLKSIKYDKITIETLSIEHNNYDDVKQKIISHLKANRFINVESTKDSIDVYFKRNASSAKQSH